MYERRRKQTGGEGAEAHTGVEATFGVSSLANCLTFGLWGASSDDGGGDGGGPGIADSCSELFGIDVRQLLLCLRPPCLRPPVRLRHGGPRVGGGGAWRWAPVRDEEFKEGALASPAGGVRSGAVAREGRHTEYSCH